jgi:hypothetical protein
VDEAVEVGHAQYEQSAENRQLQPVWFFEGDESAHGERELGDEDSPDQHEEDVGGEDLVVFAELAAVVADHEGHGDLFAGVAEFVQVLQAAEDVEVPDLLFGKVEQLHVLHPVVLLPEVELLLLVDVTRLLLAGGCSRELPVD